LQQFQVYVPAETRILEDRCPRLTLKLKSLLRLYPYFVIEEQAKNMPGAAGGRVFKKLAGPPNAIRHHPACGCQGCVFLPSQSRVFLVQVFVIIESNQIVSKIEVIPLDLDAIRFEQKHLIR
jgi:hypothetical protein